MAYHVRAGDLYFDPTCYCSRTSRYPVQAGFRSWQDAADWINMQEDETARAEIMQKFGLTVTQKD